MSSMRIGGMQAAPGQIPILPALYDDFRAGQANQGRTETVAMQGVGDAMLGFRKGDRTVVANFRPDREGHVLVSLSLQPQAAVSAR